MISSPTLLVLQIRGIVLACGAVATLLIANSAYGNQQANSTDTSSVNSQFIVIANPSVVDDTISLPELKRIMMGDHQFWTASQPVTCVVPPKGTQERSFLLKRVYGMSELQYGQFWIGRVFRMEVASPPVVATSLPKVIELVRSTRGAVSLVTTSTVPRGVKVLTVQGLNGQQ